MKKGFTLIELLVVVLIIGILAAIALPQYEKAVWKSRATQALISFDALIKGATLYKLSTGTYPADTDALDIELPAIDATYSCSASGTTAISCMLVDNKLDLLLQWWSPDAIGVACHKSCNARPNNKNSNNFCISLGNLYEEGLDDGIQGYWNRYCMQP